MTKEAAAPNPCTRRDSKIISIVGAKEQPKLPKRKKRDPTISMGRLPNRSDKGPQKRAERQNPKKFKLMVPSTISSETLNALAMSGKLGRDNSISIAAEITEKIKRKGNAVASRQMQMFVIMISTQ